jgi:hypothetical protein
MLVDVGAAAAATHAPLPLAISTLMAHKKAGFYALFGVQMGFVCTQKPVRSCCFKKLSPLFPTDG